MHGIAASEPLPSGRGIIELGPVGRFRDLAAQVGNHPHYIHFVTHQLYGCAQNNSLPHFQELIDVHPDILTMTFADVGGGTAAHFCAQFNCPELLRELASHGVSLTEAKGELHGFLSWGMLSSPKETPLQRATTLARKEVLAQLLEAEADVSKQLALGTQQ